MNEDYVSEDAKSVFVAKAASSILRCAAIRTAYRGYEREYTFERHIESCRKHYNHLARTLVENKK